MRDVQIEFPIGDNPPAGRLLYGIGVREGLRLLDAESIHTVATSPPYWGLRDYGVEGSVWGGDPTCVHNWSGHSLTRKGGATGRIDMMNRLSPHGDGKTNQHGVKTEYRRDRSDTCGLCGAWFGQLGLEPRPDLYVCHLVEVFREVRRVLRPDGTLWVNLGDSYAQGHGQWPSKNSKNSKGNEHNQRLEGFWDRKGAVDVGLKEKDLVGIPWRVALALQQDGWYLRNDIIWQKTNPMPSPVQDRFSNTYEHVFMLTRSPRYFFDLDAVRTPHTFGTYDEEGSFTPAQTWNEDPDITRKMDLTEGQLGTMAGPPRKLGRGFYHPVGKNPGDVLQVPTQPFVGAHFAVWPQALPERFIRAGTSEHGCCVTCGAPWRRAVKRDDAQPNSKAGGGPKAKTSQGLREAGGVGRLDGGRRDVKGSTFHNNPHKRKHPSRAFLGWEPTCSCEQGGGVRRAVVLDPFSGSGTTGMVALRLGRDYVGLDLNESYVAMAIARLRDDVAPAQSTAPPEGSVVDLFGSEEP